MSQDPRQKTVRAELAGDPPPPIDGRNIDPERGILQGEGSLQEIRSREIGRERGYRKPEPGEDATATPGSYYGLQLLKDPVWKAWIPLYFYVGGAAGAAAAMGAAAQLRRDAQDGLLSATRITALAGSAVSAGLLIVDLGRPTRFLNMLRVFRPTSPMNMGAWILTGFGGASAAALGLQLLGMRRAADAAGLAAGVLGTGLATYTGVLLAGTAVPVWQESRAELPQLFGASGAASAGALMDLVPGLSPASRRIAGRVGALGKLGELLIGRAMEKRCAAIPQVARPLHHGLSGALLKLSKLCTTASLALTFARDPALRKARGLLGTAGALTLRFALLRAGTQSARDPHATFAQQRAGHGAAEVTGQPALAGPEPRLAVP